MDLGAWLRGLGLGQFEARFRDSEIEADVPPDLTGADLGHSSHWSEDDQPMEVALGRPMLTGSNGLRQ